VVVLVKALYGLKSSGAAWHLHLSKRLRAMQFVLSLADADMWMRWSTRPDATSYYQYIASYVDDLTIVTLEPEKILDELKGHGYELKGSGAPDTFLGASIGRHTFTDGSGSAWYQSAEDYLQNAIKTVEERLGHPLPTGRVSTPLDHGYHPEIDENALLDDDQANYYQSMIGILLWASGLGPIDITQEVGMMAQFGALPREGHYKAVLRIFSYLKKHIKSRLVYNTNIADVTNKEFAVATWSEQYPDAGETLPYDMPEPLGKRVKITAFCDASHADCSVTQKSTTGILIFFNSTPT
jgi:hypothetical protein